MKKLFNIICASLIISTASAQTPEFMSYQAVVRDANNALVSNTSVRMQISILQGSINGSPVYVETQNPTSNDNGLVSISIGNGSVVSGSINSIDWSDGPYFLKTEIDPTGGSAYTISGTSQLQSVPYAFYAKKAGGLSSPYAETDPVYGVSVANGITGADTAYWNNKLDTEIDGSITNEIQSLYLSNDSLYILDGNSVFLGGVYDSNWTRSGNYVYNASDSIGIGTSTPGANLEVAGHIWQTGTGESVFIGEGAGASDDLSINRNVFVGYRAGYANSTGSDNTGNGHRALAANTIGFANTAMGQEALTANTIGYHNTAIGWKALFSNTIGDFNTATGSNALRSNTTGYSNTAIGVATLLLNSTGVCNTAIGSEALQYNMTGGYNTANGYQALYTNTIGVRNTAIGSEALELNTTGNQNTASGCAALYWNGLGNNNTANGYKALFQNVQGNNNTAFGNAALYNNSTGNGNTAVGHNALDTNTTGSFNTAIGQFSYTSLSASAFSNSTAIGYNSQIGGSNQIHLGNSSVTEIKGQVAFTTYSDGRIKDNVSENVVGLEFINRLRPVTYNFNLDRQNSLMGIEDESEYAEKYDIEKIAFSGFIAQEVETAAKESNYEFSGVKKPKSGNELYGVSYAEFVVPLVKAMQEQQEMIEDQQRQIDELRAIVKKISR